MTMVAARDRSFLLKYWEKSWWSEETRGHFISGDDHQTSDMNMDRLDISYIILNKTHKFLWDWDLKKTDLGQMTKPRCNKKKNKIKN